MKKFQFELEEILNIRKFEQQQAEIELGKALASENEIQNFYNRYIKTLRLKIDDDGNAKLEITK